MIWRLLLISFLVGGLAAVSTESVKANFVDQTVSPVLVVKVGDWQPPALSFYLTPADQTSIPLSQVIQNSDFTDGLNHWQVENTVSHEKLADEGQTWARLKANSSQTSASLSQPVQSSDQPRWLAFTYRVTAQFQLCGLDFVPVQLTLDQKLIWYLPDSTCRDTTDEWQTALVGLPQTDGDLSFTVKTIPNVDLVFDITSITTLAVGLTNQDVIQIKVNEDTLEPNPDNIHYVQDGHQVFSYQFTDLAGKISPTYQLYLSWLSAPPQLGSTPQIYRDSPDELSLALTLNSSSECLDLSFDPGVISAVVRFGLNWTESNSLLCGLNLTNLIALTTEPGMKQLQVILTDLTGIRSELSLVLPS